MKKNAIISVVIIVCIVVSSFALSVSAQTVNIDETPDKIRITVGSTVGMNLLETTQYNSRQDTLIANRARKSPEETTNALISFSSFLTATDTQELVDNVVATTVYLWVPNKEGRCIIDVRNNNIEDSILEYFASVDYATLSSVQASDFTELKENYGIFAVEVYGDYDSLNELRKDQQVHQIALFECPELVTRTMDVKKQVSYICIPDKPDGTY